MSYELFERKLELRTSSINEYTLIILRYMSA